MYSISCSCHSRAKILHFSNNANNTEDNVYGAVIIIKSLQSWPGSSDECRRAPTSCQSKTKSYRLGHAPAIESELFRSSHVTDFSPKSAVSKTQLA